MFTFTENHSKIKITEKQENANQDSNSISPNFHMNDY
jgi:hypothetical protein